MNNVRSFKLPSGQEIIGKEVETTSRGIILKDVRELAPMQQRDQTFSLGLAPYTFSSQGDRIELFFSSVVGEVLCIPAALEKEYLSNVSGISLATTL